MNSPMLSHDPRHADHERTRVFVSHASEDHAIAVNLCELIEAQGIPCWIAPRDVRPGFNYGEEIVQAIERCATLVLLLSADANDSDAIASEIEQAFRSRRHIVPVRLTEVEPSSRLRFFLGPKHWVDATEEPRERAFHDLVSLLFKLRKEAGHFPDAEVARTPVSAAQAWRRLVLGTIASGFLLAAAFWGIFRGAMPAQGWIQIAGGPVGVGHNRPEAWQGLQKTISTAAFDGLASPGRAANLASFFIDRNEVTNGDYERFVKKCREAHDCVDVDLSFSALKDARQKPVQRRTWTEASAYCRFASGRLPRADEWEHAGRGERQFFYPWGDEPRLTGDWVTIRDVGTRRADISPFGAQDLAGNVAEWVDDELACGDDPAGTICREVKGIGAIRMARDGSAYFEQPGVVPLFYQLPMPHDVRFDGIGFRCAHDVRPLHALVPHRTLIVTSALALTCVLATALLILPVLQRHLESSRRRRRRGAPPPPPSY